MRAEIAAERLVEWQPGDGWEPVCRVFGVPVPDRLLLHQNSTSDYLARKQARAYNDERRVVSLRSSN